MFWQEDPFTRAHRLPHPVPCGLRLQARVAALTTLTTILDLVPPEVRKGQVMPIIRNHMQPLELDIAMQRCLAKMFGQLVTVVSRSDVGRPCLK